MGDSTACDTLVGFDGGVGAGADISAMTVALIS